MPPAEAPSKGDQYDHPDGTREIVFATDEGRVLTVREYPAVAAFTEGVDAAEYAGVHDGVVDLPSSDSFEDFDTGD